MPIAVDHNARKEFVISVTADLIASQGLEATTIRTVAKAAGYSTSIITHYFQDKLQLLRMTYVSIAVRRRERLEKMVATSSGDILLKCALALLPIDDASRRDWLVYCAFLASGVGNRELSDTQARWADQTVSLFSKLLTARPDYLDPTLHRKDAQALVSFLTGLSFMNLLDPTGYPSDVLLQLTEREVSRVLSP